MVPPPWIHSSAGASVGEAGRAMQSDADVLVDGGDWHGADASRVAHQIHDCALKLQTAVQGVTAGYESRHLAKAGIQHLRGREGVVGEPVCHRVPSVPLSRQTSLTIQEPTQCP